MRRASTVSRQDLVTCEWDSDDAEPIEFVSARDSSYDQRITPANVPDRRGSVDKSHETSVRFRISKSMLDFYTKIMIMIYFSRK